MIARIALLLLLADTVDAQDAAFRYATVNDLASAQSLAHAAWVAVQCAPQPSCDVRQITQYDYPIYGLSNGKYAIQVRLGDLHYGEHIVWNGKTYDLTAQQISALSTRPQMAGLLADVLTVAVVGARITPAQSTAITAYGNAHPTFKASYTTLTSGPIDLQGTSIWSVLDELQSAGILTAANVVTITTPNVVAAAP